MQRINKDEFEIPSQASKYLSFHFSVGDKTDLFYVDRIQYNNYYWQSKSYMLPSRNRAKFAACQTCQAGADLSRPKGWKAVTAYARMPNPWSLLRIAKGLSTWLLSSCAKNEVPISLGGRWSSWWLHKSCNRSTTLSAEGRFAGSWFQQSRIRSSILGFKPRRRLKSSAEREGLSPLCRRGIKPYIATCSNGIFPKNI